MRATQRTREHAHATGGGTERNACGGRARARAPDDAKTLTVSSARLPVGPACCSCLQLSTAARGPGVLLLSPIAQRGCPWARRVAPIAIRCYAQIRHSDGHTTRSDGHTPRHTPTATRSDALTVSGTRLPGGPAVWLRVRDAKVSGTRLPMGPWYGLESASPKMLR